jgi:hypothetical protein
MNKILAMIAALMLCSATLVMAADEPAAPNQATVAKEAPKADKLMPEPTAACPKMGMMGGGMGMMGNGPGSAMSPDLMKKMQEQMEKIRQSTDPAERQKLMQEHFQSMQEAMQAMHGNMGKAGGMGGCMQCCCCCQQHCAKTMGGKNCKKGGNCARGKGMGMMPQGAAMGSGTGGMMEPQRQMQQSK